MCGIVGYIGKREATPVILGGLKKLEYRGYDSAGIALLNGSLETIKKKGKVAELEKFVGLKRRKGTIGIGHTRWATHGFPNDENAHPHCSEKGFFSIVHNGIIENFLELKNDLIAHGYSFKSETDTEVIVNLIEFYYLKKAMTSAEEAIRLAMKKLVGAYAIAVLCVREKDQVIVVRKGSPIVIGLGEGEYFIASDASPIIEFTKQVVYLNDMEIAVVSPDAFELKSLWEDLPVVPSVSDLEMEIGEIDKGSFDHFMLKEIFDQPKTLVDTFRGRLNLNESEIVLGGLLEVFPRIIAAKRIILIGCGTSWHAALIGEYLLEEFAEIPVEVEYASEFRYRKPVLNQEDVVILLSQSGETADTLSAMRLAKEKGALVLGVCNVAGSSLSRETDAGVYTHAGLEIGVASTKAFMAQLTVLTMLTLKLAKARKTISWSAYKLLLQEFSEVPEKIAAYLQKDHRIKQIAAKYKDGSSALFLGRGSLFPVALEGALKLKEISYVHAEGYAAGEMKHGPIALVDDNLPVIVVAPKDNYYEKVVSNIQEVKARKGNVIAVINESDTVLKGMVNDWITIPESHRLFTPFFAVLPMQLIAYHIGVLRGCDVDQPRNLAKSVTVE